MGLRLFLVVALLGVTGWLHGRWTDRWGEPSFVADAASPLQTIPLNVGDWDGREITREESEVAYRFSPHQIIRRYVNRNTGTSVGVLITCGRPSSMIIEHTPKTCYSELGFEETSEGRRLSVGPPDARSEFFAHTFVKTTPVATSRLRLLWSWGDGQTWSFPERPRIAFSKIPVLYKIYVTREMLSEDEPISDDPALRFLETFLPSVNAALSTGSK
jgi:hypothetical protein